MTATTAQQIIDGTLPASAAIGRPDLYPELSRNRPPQIILTDYNAG